MKYNRYYAYYAAIELPETDGNSDYGVTFPDLPGACSQGMTFDDATFQAQECLALYIHETIDEGDPLPAPSRREEIEVEDGYVLALIATDMQEIFPEDFEEEEMEEPERKKWGGARAGAGRPKNTGRQATKRLVVRMTEEEDETLTRLAVAAQKTKSDYVRELIAKSDR